MVEGLRGTVEFPSPPPTSNAVIDAQRATLQSAGVPLNPNSPILLQSPGYPMGNPANGVGNSGGVTFGVDLTKIPDILATRVLNDFNIASMYKYEEEAQWLLVHENFRGQSPRPANEIAMGIRSKVTMKVTRTKVAAAFARLREIGLKYDVKPTKKPTLLDFPEEKLKEVLHQDLASMQDQALAAEIAKEMEVESMLDDVYKLALDRSRRMKKQIDDHMQEDRFDSAYDQGGLEFCLYGSMIFQGPLTKRSNPGRWVRKGGAWSFFDADGLVSYAPTTSNISVWDFYPSPGAWCVEKLEYAVVRHVCTEAEIMDLADRTDAKFRPDQITQALADGTGKWSPLQWEQGVMAANKEMDPTGVSRRHVVLEWWGTMSVAELKGYGADVPKIKRFDVKTGAMADVDPKNEDRVIANIWIIGNHVIKAMAVDLQPKRLPFFVVPYEKIPKKLFGQGPAWMMADWQAVLNTAYRAMLDNMAISALPLGWYDKSRVKNQDPTLHCGKMFVVENLDDLTIPPVQFTVVPNTTPQLRMMVEIANKNVQESTSLPDLVQGMTGPGGHNRTSSGLSIIGGWADAATRSVQRNIDRELIIPLVTAYYFWEMQLCADDGIKGDFDVVALGVNSVMADEVMVSRISEAMTAINNDPDAKFLIDKSRIYAYQFDKLGFKDEGFVYSSTDQKRLREEDQQRQQAIQENGAAMGKKYQPEMTDKDRALKYFGEIPDQALGMKVAVGKTVGEQLNLLSEEAKKAADIIIDHTMEHLGALPLPSAPVLPSAPASAPALVLAK